MTPYGTLVQTVQVDLDHRVFNWPISPPKALLWHLCETSEGLRALINRTLLGAPCCRERPWILALYIDEFTPANNLKPDNRLRTQAIYWTFGAFGDRALSSTCDSYFRCSM